MKKKAFTLIELLVVIAIIAILAAILFPVFAQAKLAAKETSALSNAKQMGLATLMYVNDYDDTFPLAAVLRPDGYGANAYKLAMGATYPYPYNDGEVLTSAAAGSAPTTVWESAARMSMAESFVANSVQPYVKSVVLESLTGLNNYSDPNDASYGGTSFVAAGLASLTFNGDLHRYSTTAVVESAVTPMWWPGSGSDNEVGHIAAAPALNCANTIDDCIFTPGGNPEAAGSSANLYATQPGDVLFLNSDPGGTPWVYSNMRGPIVRCDGSAKNYNLSIPNYPGYLTGNGSWLEPYSTYFTPAQAKTYFGLNQIVTGSNSCVDGATNTPAAPTVVDYTCFFRPDRTK